MYMWLDFILWQPEDDDAIHDRPWQPRHSSSFAPGDHRRMLATGYRPCPWSTYPGTYFYNCQTLDDDGTCCEHVVSRWSRWCFIKWQIIQRSFCRCHQTFYYSVYFRKNFIWSASFGYVDELKLKPMDRETRVKLRRNFASCRFSSGRRRVMMIDGEKRCGDGLFRIFFCMCVVSWHDNKNKQGVFTKWIKLN